MLTFLDKLMAFVEKHYTLTLFLCIGYGALVCWIAEGWLGLEDWVWEVCMLPLNLPAWMLEIIWWREFRRGSYPARMCGMEKLSVLPAIFSTYATLDLLLHLG